MKPIRIAWCLAAFALVMGCQDQVTDPATQADELTAPAFKAVHEDFTVEGPVNDLMYYSCLNDGAGEAVWERGYYVDYKGRVFTPSGNANRWTDNLEFRGLPDDHDYYFGPDYTLLGLESGDVWTMDASKSDFRARRHDKKDGFIYQQLYRAWFANQHGEKIRIKEKYAVRCDYDWNCTKERLQTNCYYEWLAPGPPEPLP